MSFSITNFNPNISTQCSHLTECRMWLVLPLLDLYKKNFLCRFFPIISWCYKFYQMFCPQVKKNHKWLRKIRVIFIIKHTEKLTAENIGWQCLKLVTSVWLIKIPWRYDPMWTGMTESNPPEAVWDLDLQIRFPLFFCACLHVMIWDFKPSFHDFLIETDANGISLLT